MQKNYSYILTLGSSSFAAVLVLIDLIILLKLLKKIFLIAIRICYCVILCYLVYKHSCLLTYYSLIYIRIVSRDRLLSFNSVKGNIT
ncbi:hypothetical protein HBH88_000050 [Parastagonospora nodorum]|nr:hypothetical protein HBH88_000050 [Parastagonospora nodorum]KAH4836073.1 hypothetical protein HBH60_013760 [Parastagonospora nodorum]